MGCVIGLIIGCTHDRVSMSDLSTLTAVGNKVDTELPKDAAGRPVYSAVKNYTDTADTGDDYLCSIDYVEYNHEAYVINVIYTKDGMEITEPAVAKMLYEDQVNDADIESNNGGRGFARNVESILRNTYHSNRTIINPFFQSKNKISRIHRTWKS